MIFFRYMKFNICIIKIINYFLFCFVILSGCIFNGFKYLIWHQTKHLFSLFLIFINLFLAFFHLSCNLMYDFADNGLLIEILTYSPFLDLIIQPDSSLIQLSIKNIFRINSSRIKVLVIEIKKTGINSLSPFYSYFLNKTFTVIWHLKPLISFNKSSKNL